jgi:hypothetical protein
LYCGIMVAYSSFETLHKYCNAHPMYQSRIGVYATTLLPVIRRHIFYELILSYLFSLMSD